MSDIHSPRYQYFLKRLRQARKLAGYTQKEAAAALGVPQNYVSKSETGERRVDIVEAADFAALYGRPVSYFLKRRRKKKDV